MCKKEDYSLSIGLQKISLIRKTVREIVREIVRSILTCHNGTC